MQLDCRSHPNLRPWEASHHWPPLCLLCSHTSALHYVPGSHAGDIQSGWCKAGAGPGLADESAKQSNALGSEARQAWSWTPRCPGSLCPPATSGAQWAHASLPTALGHSQVQLPLMSGSLPPGTCPAGGVGAEVVASRAKAWDVGLQLHGEEDNSQEDGKSRCL